MFLIFLYIFATAYAGVIGDNNNPITDCAEVGDCIEEHMKCNNSIGLYYNESIDDCVLNIKQLLETLTQKYDTHEKIRAEVESVFQGVIISVILFVSCASLCIITSCVYCCRINYIDYQLKNDVEALANKLQRDYNLKRPKVRTAAQPASESCNIIVEDAGVFVV